MATENPFELKGYDHIKVALKNVSLFEKQIKAFGFNRYTGSAPAWMNQPQSVWGSGDAVFVLYDAQHTMAKKHYDIHGDTVFDLAFVVETKSEHPMSYDGVGGMKHTLVRTRTFPKFPSPRGILRFDHNTINVDKGDLNPTVDHYMKTFGLNKGQYFNIKGAKTGLYSWVTRSKDYSVQIPFNETADEKSQIQEYIDMHRGPGVQHIAILTDSCLKTMNDVSADTEAGVEFLDIPDTYYEIVGKRVKIRENLKDLAKYRLLVDQDEKGGYLIQIFTKNLFGPIFLELIQREGNEGFGEGNFQALFDSIELDQKRRGVI